MKLGDLEIVLGAPSSLVRTFLYLWRKRSNFFLSKMNENLKNLYHVLFIASSIKIATYLFKCGGCTLSYLFHESRNTFFFFSSFQGKDTAEFLTKGKCPGGRQGHDLSLQQLSSTIILLTLASCSPGRCHPHGPFPSQLLRQT